MLNINNTKKLIIDKKYIETKFKALFVIFSFLLLLLSSLFKRKFYIQTYLVCSEIPKCCLSSEVLINKQLEYFTFLQHYRVNKIGIFLKKIN